MDRPLRAILLDAMGTLLELEAPGPLLAARLAGNHVQIGVEDAERAFRAEISYYREHHMEGADPKTLAALRRSCATVLHSALPEDAKAEVAVEKLEAMMLCSLRFLAAAGAREALAAMAASGLRLVVVSNWDISLAQALDAAQLRGALDAVVTSAGVGAAKPDPAIFTHALALVGVEPGEAIHVGDSPELDAKGAQAAHVQPVLVGATSPGVPTLRSISELPAFVDSLRRSQTRARAGRPQRRSTRTPP